MKVREDNHRCGKTQVQGVKYKLDSIAFYLKSQCIRLNNFQLVPVPVG